MVAPAEAVQQVAIWVWQATWRASVLIVLVFAVRALFGRRLSPKWNCALWLLVLIRLLVPYGPASGLSLFNLVPQSPAAPTMTHAGETAKVETTTGGQGAVPVSSGGAGGTPQGVGVQTQAAGPGPLQAWKILAAVLPWIWLAGVVALAVQIVVVHYGLCRIVRFERAVTHAAALGVLEDCRARMRIGTLLGVVLTEQVQTPALLGFVRPRLLMPTGLSRHVTAHDLRHVFMHELAHLRRQDVAVGWLVSLCQVLHWFNPLVWLAFHTMRVDREMACDELAMSYARDPNDARGYGLTLIRMQEVLGRIHPVAALAAICEGKSQLKARMERIADFGRSRSWPWMDVLAGTLVVLVAIAGLTDATGPAVGVETALAATQGEADNPISVAHVVEAGPDEDAAMEDPAAAAPGLVADLLQSMPAPEGSVMTRPSDKVYLHYDFDKVSAKQVVDVSASGHHGLLLGDPVRGQGVEGDGLLLDGQDDFITVETLPAEAFTLCLWVKPDQPVSGQSRHVLMLISPTAQIDVSMDGLGRLEWQLRSGRGSGTSSTLLPGQSAPEAWSHLAVAFDQGQVRLYLDGVRMDGRGIAWPGPAKFVNIGGGSYGSWKGLIDEVTIYTEALEQGRIRQIVSALKAVDPAIWEARGPQGTPEAAEHSLQIRQSIARSTLRQLGYSVELIAGQWAPSVCGGNWRQADAMLPPLRSLRIQLTAYAGVGEEVSRPDSADLGGPTSMMPPRSVAQAVDVLCQNLDSTGVARASVSTMAGLVDRIIKAVETRDGISVQTGSSELRKACRELLAVIGMENDTQFQAWSTMQFNKTMPRPQPARVRGRSTRLGR